MPAARLVHLLMPHARTFVDIGSNKGYSAARGAETAWVASEAAGVPVFPIGGITPVNAGELESIGRAAVASSLLAAEDPVAAAETLRAALVS